MSKSKYRRKTMRRKGMRRKTMRRKGMRRKTMRRKTMRRKTMRRRSKQYKQIGGEQFEVEPLQPGIPPWIKDEDRSECQNYSCKRVFNVYYRKHHCRMCGEIFCSKCLQRVEWKVASMASFTPGLAGPSSSRGKKLICDDCLRFRRPMSEIGHGAMSQLVPLKPI